MTRKNYGKTVARCLSKMDSAKAALFRFGRITDKRVEKLYFENLEIRRELALLALFAGGRGFSHYHSYTKGMAPIVAADRTGVLDSPGIAINSASRWCTRARQLAEILAQEAQKKATSTNGSPLNKKENA